MSIKQLSVKQLNNHMAPKQKATCSLFIMRQSAYGFRTYPLKNIGGRCPAALPVPTPPTPPACWRSTFFGLPEKIVEYLPFTSLTFLV